jgi:uncharacterized membrane protein (DUF373 family)
MARRRKTPWRWVTHNFENELFLERLRQVEGIVARILSILMVLVILVTVVDLGVVLYRALLIFDQQGFLQSILTEIFGIFLSVLIALEILENITAYIRKHVVQAELVLATALTAVARKLIILDLEKVSGVSLVGLAAALLALSISYFIVRTVHQTQE